MAWVWLFLFFTFRKVRRLAICVRTLIFKAARLHPYSAILCGADADSLPIRKYCVEDSGNIIFYSYFCGAARCFACFILRCRIGEIFEKA